MSSALPNARHELKFIAEGRAQGEILALVRRHPAAFYEAFRPRIVNNIYLDSPALGDYQDHVDGIANRTKSRVRWYGEPASLIKTPVFERKLRRGLITGKTTHGLPAFSLDGSGATRQLCRAFDGAKMPELLRVPLRHREPSVFNRYRRHYFVSGDGRFRLTVDSELRFGAVGKAALADGFLSPSAPFLVVELKFAPAHAEHAAALTGRLPFRLARCSKYVLGIQSVRL